MEKQKARYTYLITEKQFAKYVKEVLEKKDAHGRQRLYAKLESRLDNTAYRAGFRPTRTGARQLVSHGHVMVNGKKVTIPSFNVKVGDVVSVRPQSSSSPMFADIIERTKTYTPPQWLKTDLDKLSATVTGVPDVTGADTMFDLNAVLEYYSR